MSRERYDTGIDWLRLAAAILVIAIHTSPLAVQRDRELYPDKGPGTDCGAFFLHNERIFSLIQVSR